VTANVQPKAGDILSLNLNPTVGHEQSGSRPCIVVSIPAVGKQRSKDLGIMIIVPLTSRPKNWWTVVPVPIQTGLTNDSYALCHQIRAVSTKRIRDVSGSVNEKELAKIRLVLGTILNLN
jgi:mRNA interferase MazF